MIRLNSGVHQFLWKTRSKTAQETKLKTHKSISLQPLPLLYVCLIERNQAISFCSFFFFWGCLKIIIVIKPKRLLSGQPGLFVTRLQYHFPVLVRKCAPCQVSPQDMQTSAREQHFLFDLKKKNKEVLKYFTANDVRRGKCMATEKSCVGQKVNTSKYFISNLTLRFTPVYLTLCFPITFKYDLGNCAIRLTTCE